MCAQVHSYVWVKKKLSTWWWWPSLKHGQHPVEHVHVFFVLSCSTSIFFCSFSTWKVIRCPRQNLAAPQFARHCFLAAPVGVKVAWLAPGEAPAWRFILIGRSTGCSSLSVSSWPAHAGNSKKGRGPLHLGVLGDGNLPCSAVECSDPVLVLEDAGEAQSSSNCGEAILDPTRPWPC